ncbi:hypothetical protein H8958_009903 [Nasalis larvatus]
MSATGDRRPTEGDQEAPVSQEGAQAEAAGAGNPEGGDSGPDSRDMVPAAEVVGVAGPMEGLGEEEGEQAAGLATVPGGGSAEEDPDIGPAAEEEEEEEEEEERNEAGNLDLAAIIRRNPAAGISFVFLDMVHSLLLRLYHNDHIVIATRHHSRQLLGPRAAAPNRRGEPSLLLALQRLGPGAAALEGQGLGLIQEAASVPEPVVPGNLAEMAREPTEEAAEEPVEEEAAEEKPAEEATEKPAAEEATAPEGVTKSQPEKWDEEAQDAAGEEEKEQEKEKDAENKAKNSKGT